VLFRIDRSRSKSRHARMQAQVESVKSLLDAGAQRLRVGASGSALVRRSLADQSAPVRAHAGNARQGPDRAKDLDDASNNLAAARGKRDSNAAR
jgi:membrane fusion protein (multidrug efflux system)